MDETQDFRLAGSTAVEKIACDHVNGYNVIYWEDIELAFPGVKHVKYKGRIVKPMRNSDHKRIVPHCIEYHPGVVLDVVVLFSDENTSVAAGRNKDTASASTEDDGVETLQITQEPVDTSSVEGRDYTLPGASDLPYMSIQTDFQGGSRGSLSFKQIVKVAQKKSMESEIEQQLVSFLPYDLQVQVRTSTNVREYLIQVIKDGLVHQPNEHLIACLQKLDDKMTENNELATKITDLVCKNNELASKNNDLGSRIVELVLENNQIASESKDQLAQISQLQKDLAFKQEEMKQLQIQALDRLALIQRNAQALLTQTYELHEYPIPRLFIVLPQDSSSRSPLDLVSNKFRLYFLCECGEHTKSTNSKIPHHIHLAKHDGIDISRPNEFFRQYGSYVLTILQMFKYGISVGIPTLSQLAPPDTMGQITDGLKMMKDTIGPGINQVIDCIEKVTADEGQAVIGFLDQTDNNEALEGADLRQLKSFLKNKDENRVLGSLYRTVTTDGHVKWVCIDHFRENYHEEAAKTFLETMEALRGQFDENIGRVDVTLRSRLQAEQFYQALETASSVYELKLHLFWDTTQSDFHNLRNTLPKTSIGVLELHLLNADGQTSDTLERNQQYDPILDIMQHSSIQSFMIRGPENFSERSSLLSRNEDFPNLRYLDISLSQLKADTPGVKCLVAKATRLSSLCLEIDALRDDYFQFLGHLNAISEYQTYPITIRGLDFCIPPPSRESNKAMTGHRYLDDLTKAYFQRSRVLTLDGSDQDEQVVGVLAKAVDYGTGLDLLVLERVGELCDPLINNISRIIQSELRFLSVYMRKDEGRVRVLQSIQWEHLRELRIWLTPGTFETSVMRALVDGVQNASGNVELVTFCFRSETNAPLTLPQEQLLQTFIASMSLKRLALAVDMTLEQMLSLFRSMDVSKLQTLDLWVKGFDSVKVDFILDGLQHASSLIALALHHANLTQEQKRHMLAKGVLLYND